MKRHPFLTLVTLALVGTVTLVRLHAQPKVKFDLPVLITSAGQSADVTIAGMLFKRASIPAKTVPLAKASDLEGIQTLVVVAGYSSKGLGAAGISREQEIDRVEKLLAAARGKKLRIVVLHIGGKARRGNQSDDFNKMAAESSSYLLIVKQGNEDGFFSTIATTKKVPIKLLAKISDAVEPIGSMFTK